MDLGASGLYRGFTGFSSGILLCSIHAHAISILDIVVE